MSILPVGFVKWDGTKYIIVSEIDLSGPAGPPGPQGPAGVAIGPASGDLGGNYPNPLVVKLQGRSISSTAPTDGQLLTWVALNNDWEPQPSPSGFTAGGDLSGSSSNQDVINIHGASVPIAGSLTTGNVLQVTGASALSYGAVNLAGGANFVTGTLPAGNQDSQTMGGDVTGTTASNTVVTLTGSAGIVSLPSGTSLNLDTGSGTFPTTGLIRIKNYASDNTILSVRNDGGSSPLLVSNGATYRVTLGDTSATTGTDLIVQASFGMTVQSRASAINFYCAGAGYQFSNYSTGVDNITLPSVGSGAAALLQFGSLVVPSIIQKDLTTNSGTGATLTIQAQNETGTTSTGGNLNLASGTGTSTNGAILISPGGTEIGRFGTGSVLTMTSQRLEILGSGGGRVDMGSWADSPSYGAIYLSVTPAGGNYTIFGTGVDTYINTPGAGAMHFDINNVDIIDLTATALTVGAAVSAFTLKQADLTTVSGTGATLTIQAQNETGTTSIGGNLVLLGGTGTSTNGTINANSDIKLNAASGTFPTFGQIRAKESSTIISGYSNGAGRGLLSVDAFASVVVGSDASNGNACATVQMVASTAFAMFQPGVSTMWYWTNSDYTMQMYYTDAAPTIKQRDLTTNSGTGNVFTIQAQNETGTTSTGGNLVLTSGTGTSTNGSTILQVGGTAKLTLAPTISTLTSANTTKVISGTQTVSLDGVSATALWSLVNSVGFASTSGASTSALTINVADTGATNLTFSATVTTPSIKQSDASSASGANLTIQAQNGNGVGNSGGNLILQSGAKATGGTDGLVDFIIGNNLASHILTDTLLRFDKGAAFTVFHQQSSTGDGYSLTIQAQAGNGAGVTNGGDLILNGGAPNSTGIVGAVRIGTDRNDWVSTNGQSIYGQKDGYTSTIGATGTIETFALPDNAVTSIYVTVSAYQTAGTGSPDAAEFQLKGVWFNSGGSATVIKAPTVVDSNTNINGTAWTAVLLLSGTNVSINVTGDAGKTIHWSCTRLAYQGG